MSTTQTPTTPNLIPIEACLDSDPFDPPLRFSPHFPTTRPECMEDAALFFYCFTSKSAQLNREVCIRPTSSSLLLLLLLVIVAVREGKGERQTI